MSLSASPGAALTYRVDHKLFFSVAETPPVNPFERIVVALLMAAANAELHTWHQTLTQ